MNLPKLFLAVNAATFLAFGVAFLVAPVELAANAELGVETPTARWLIDCFTSGGNSPNVLPCSGTRNSGS